MLLSYGFKNYFSFKEGADVSFVLDGKVPRQISNGLPFSTVLCIKGANASGKTNILRALSFLSTFATRSFDWGPDAAIPVRTHFESTSPAEFYVEFAVKGHTYLYELLATVDEVLEERVYRTKIKKVLVLERKKQKITHATREFNRLKTIKIRKNASLISLAKQYEFKELDPVYRFFDAIFSNVTYSGLRLEPLSESTVSAFHSAHSDLFAFVKRFICEVDVGISDISVVERTNPQEDDTHFAVFHHGSREPSRGVMSESESSGTKALYRNLALYRATLQTGGVLIADEFDVHLHPHILPKILGLFLDKATNPKDAQLILTTHNSDVMDLLGRYRTYIVGKEDNESFCYRLDEVPGDILRNDRPISPVYKEGKIGGVPKL